MISRETSQKLYFIVSGLVFLLVAVFHLLRMVLHWPIVVGTLTVPNWLSYIGFPASSAYFVWAACLLRKGKKTDRINPIR